MTQRYNYSIKKLPHQNSLNSSYSLLLTKKHPFRVSNIEIKRNINHFNSSCFVIIVRLFSFYRIKKL